MIDRNAFRISGLIFLAMIAASFWQVSQLHHALNGLVLFGLFALPVSLLAMLSTPFIQWRASPKENLPAWRRWSGKWIVSWSVFFALVQAFVLAHSLGLVSLSRLGSARAVLVYIGVMFMILGNAAPKAPSLPQRNSLELDSWQKSRMLRFAGKLFVVLGLAFVIGGVLMPLEYWEPILGCLMLAALVAGVWYHIKLQHEPHIIVLGDLR